MTAHPRITFELKQLKKNTDAHAGQLIELIGDDIRQWRVSFLGPDKTPFEGGVFILRFTFPANFPFKAPEIKFETKVFHPNINETGEICLDILKNAWSPGLHITDVVLSLCSLLNSPNPDDPLAPDVAKLYKDNRPEYNKRTREYVAKYATPKK
jgi:ubiquitin-conjugating enzyme E2 D